MSDNSSPEREALTAAEWDIPMTEDFVDRVRRGVRRHRRRRVLVAGGALLATAGVVGAVAVAANTLGPVTGEDASPAASATASVSASDSVDGFRLGYLPSGARRDGRDSIHTSAVGSDGLREGGAAPAPGEPSAAVTVRRFTVAPTNYAMFVSVLRPNAGAGAQVSTETVGAWLLTGLRVDDRTESFPVPAGRAYLVTHRGTEVTTTSLVVATASGAVVTVEGPAALSADELRRVAQGLSA